MPGSECSVFFVVISVGQLSFKHIWVLAFCFFFFPIPSNFGVWKTRGKTAALSHSFWVSLSLTLSKQLNIALPTAQACCCLPKPNISHGSQTGSLPPLVPFQRNMLACRVGSLMLPARTQMISSQKMMGNMSLLTWASLWSWFLPKSQKWGVLRTSLLG